MPKNEQQEPMDVQLVETYSRCPNCNFMVPIAIEVPVPKTQAGTIEFDMTLDDTAETAGAALDTILQGASIAGANAAEFAKALHVFSGELASGDKGENAKAIFAKAIHAANLAQQKNRELEKLLAESTREITHLRDNLHQARQTARTDPLTGIANRGVFDEAIKRAVATADSRRPVCLLMLDIDHFKRVNDTYGHPTGDLVLKRLAKVLINITKGKDTAARYGGEEFAIVLPETTLADAHKLAETIRAGLNSAPIRDRATGTELTHITISIGVACLKTQETVADFIKRADTALYKAKTTGRNKVVVDS